MTIHVKLTKILKETIDMEARLQGVSRQAIISNALLTALSDQIMLLNRAKKVDPMNPFPIYTSLRLSTLTKDVVNAYSTNNQRSVEP